MDDRVALRVELFSISMRLAISCADMSSRLTHLITSNSSSVKNRQCLGLLVFFRAGGVLSGWESSETNLKLSGADMCGILPARFIHMVSWAGGGGQGVLPPWAYNYRYLKHDGPSGLRIILVGVKSQGWVQLALHNGWSFVGQCVRAKHEQPQDRVRSAQI